MAAICNKRAELTRQYDSLRSAVDSDYKQMAWAQADFQTNVGKIDWWADFTQKYDSFKEAREAVLDALRPGRIAIATVREGPAIALLREEIEWTTFNVMDAATGQVSKHRIEALTQMTEDQLRLLKIQQKRMEKDVSDLKKVSLQLQPLLACDMTLLVRKEPGESGNLLQKATTLGTAQTEPPPTPAKQVKGGGGHTGLILLVGGGAAAGVAAYAVGVAMKNQSSSQSCQVPVHCNALSPGPPGCLSGQPFVNALGTHCRCMGFPSGHDLGAGVSCP
jgi:hypothetical protein